MNVENNEAGVIQPEPRDEPLKRAPRILWLLGMAGALIWLAFALKGYLIAAGSDRWLGTVLIPLSLALVCAAEGFGFPLSRAFQWTFGRVKYEQIESLELDLRLRKRYDRQIQEFAANGFVRAFNFGETFHVAQLLLILPAIIISMMLLNREVLYVDKWRIGIAHPVFAAGDGSAMGHVFGLGAKFYTSFQDGTLVVTKSFKDRLPDSPAVIKHGGKGSITAAWVDHQNDIRGLEGVGKTIDRQTSFDFYISVLDRG